MASALLNLNLRCSRTLRACISEERSHGMPTVKNNMAISDSQVSDNPPLVSALKASANQKVSSFHFPGHNRGRAAPSSLTRLIGVQPFLHDLPELPLDSLFAPEGPILGAQKQAAKLFGAKETWFLVGGTTCGIQASIMATCSPGDTLILPRNSHISAFSAMVLSGVVPKYIIPEYDFDWDIACGITPSQVEKAINELDTEGRKASAVLITSPTYHGICSDLEEICRLFNPQGNIINRERICQCLQTLQSTSPSYLLLASLDAARAQISKKLETIFNKPVEIAMEAKSLIEKIPGIRFFNSSTFEL
ncbi:hypothetical protein L1987_54593 [Smallanthus sonchifolius]|uniref:Uncharacterized protein n=1 Tax=Smallanthus sonchifolius TaxID=185202 RepID=A0ACB9E7I0_9ASTR|nr:hypothetical protein L1987_54593 [Smallanthus sonchifolius]